MIIMSVKMSKIISMVLLASILAISFSLVTSSNAFASQVWESSIAKFTYPDTWKIYEIVGNGEGISLEHVNEPNVHVDRIVFQDSANGFVNLVEDIVKFYKNNGVKIEGIIKNVPGDYLFSISYTVNGIYMIGGIDIQQFTNDNDVVLGAYYAESSKYQQYNDVSGFYVDTKLSPQEVSMNQNLIDQSNTNIQIQTAINNRNHETMMNIIDLMDGTDDYEYVH
jgi:hypothetical protein